MDRLKEAVSLGLVIGIIHGLMQPSHGVPVVPNFTQGSLTQKTETTSKVTEVINSMDYNTGYQYSVTGTNVKHSGKSISPNSKLSTSSSNSTCEVTSGASIGRGDI